MRISDWSSDVCSSDLTTGGLIMGRPSGDSGDLAAPKGSREETEEEEAYDRLVDEGHERLSRPLLPLLATGLLGGIDVGVGVELSRGAGGDRQPRSEEHTSELQSLMRISSAVFCLKKK